MNYIGYPYHLSGSGSTASTTKEKHLTDMIEQLLFTNVGERVNRPGFGCGLVQFVFQAANPERLAALQFLMQAELRRWLSDLIDVQEVRVDADEGTVHVGLRYLVRASGEIRERTFRRTTT